MLPQLPRATTLKDAPAYWFLGSLHVLLAKSESNGGAFSLIHLTASPDFATPYHRHHTEDEAFYVLDGEITAICDGEKTVLGAGGYIFLPRGSSHGFRSSSEQKSQVLIHTMPGSGPGFVEMMLEMATPAKERVQSEAGPPDFERLKILCEKNKIDILGPLPE